ncbi:hypothetical protein L873DRAFT_1812824 [Choiromyces venosus 120613-1]|uniref:C2H2-type domain-containing protein n=1 Tax=Choiromyces venosus 120613-1 TaxID=1336337 RepID=A0A3N4JB40_9PEZI|nr:hypothetical protein L873DRAFT_1812824 [Choiromyces venosus 120613-1]
MPTVVQTGEMSSSQYDIPHQIDHSSGYDYYPMGTYLTLLPEMAIRMMEDYRMYYLCCGDSDEVGSFQPLQNGLTHPYTPSNGISDIIYDSAIDPTLYKIDAGTKIVTTIASPPVYDEPPSGARYLPPSTNHPNPNFQTTHRSKKRLRMKKIAQTPYSKSTRPRFYCDFGGCGKDYGRKSELQRHFRVEHMKDGGGNCSRCGIFINRSDNLFKHERKPTKTCLKKREAMEQGLEIYEIYLR